MLAPSTLSLINSKNKYYLGPSIKSTDSESIFPFVLSEECFFFEQEVDLNFWFTKGQSIVTSHTSTKEYNLWLESIQAVVLKMKNGNA